MPHLLNENLFNTPLFMIKTSKRPRANLFFKNYLRHKTLAKHGASNSQDMEKGEIYANNIPVSGSSSQKSGSTCLECFLLNAA